MVDTIVMRVHDLRRHADLVQFINTNFKGTSMNTIILPKEEADDIINSQTIDAKTYIDYFYNSKSGTHLVRFRDQQKLNSSGHYYFHVKENLDRDFIEFNFSVPKYLFGTNVLMFCPHYWDKSFNYYTHSSFDHNLKLSYKLLMNFIKWFFKTEFPFDNIVDYSSVEINRIDISFNQVFDDKKFAFEYLEYQKKLRKKNLRIESNNFKEYETSLMYSTERYSVKIYHKGTEYKKHDKQEHVRINNEKGREYFNVERLQSFANKILRYEVTLRDSMLSYLFNHKVFRKNCPIHKKRYEIYKKVESIKQKNDVIAKKTGSYKLAAFKERYIKNNPYIPIDRNELSINKAVSELLNRKRQFLLSTDSSIDTFNTKTIMCDFEARAHFSKELFIECARFFKTFVIDFQIKEKPSEAVVSERIDKYNFEHYNKLPKSEMLKFYLMLQNFSFEEIMKKGIYSRATFYRYKNRFEKIGVTQNNILLSDFIHTSVDLGLYHTHIIYNNIIKIE